MAHTTHLCEMDQKDVNLGSGTWKTSLSVSTPCYHHRTAARVKFVGDISPLKVSINSARHLLTHAVMNKPWSEPLFRADTATPAVSTSPYASRARPKTLHDEERGLGESFEMVQYEDELTADFEEVNRNIPTDFNGKVPN